MKEVSFERGTAAEKYFVEFERDNPILAKYFTTKFDTVAKEKL